jgi:SpoVK/Ycf46/Vps4 family AAA+-type ATPase
MSFPAKQISTDKPLKELPFSEQQAADIQRMIDWLKSGNPQEREPKTFQALFIGPPGSGKKSTAIHIAQETQCDIFKIDTCELLTKYIGKAEENLEILFTRAEQKQWILYFDEADSLFGKNNGNGNGKEEKQASIEINSLLRSIRFYPGLVILTTKKKKKIDPSYLAGFNAILDFNDDEETI